MSNRVQITNYLGLQAIDFSPQGVCVIIGQNGCGKTTLLSTIRSLKHVVTKGYTTIDRSV